MSEEIAKRFDEVIEKTQFSGFEMIGYATKPKLAIKLGMAMGYKLALEDMEQKIQPQPTTRDER